LGKNSFGKEEAAARLGEHLHQVGIAPFDDGVEFLCQGIHAHYGSIPCGKGGE
jgi:hypothetical protein